MLQREGGMGGKKNKEEELSEQKGNYARFSTFTQSHGEDLKINEPCQ